MEITITELVLLVWAVAATVACFELRSKFNFHRFMTKELVMMIARGKIRVVETKEGVEFMEVTNVSPRDKSV